MISFEQVSVTYPDAPRPVLHEVSFEVEEGELALVVGRTGTGKSTLLRCVNGLVPHFTGGTLSGRVRVAGRDTRNHPPRDLADLVGVVGQDPVDGFVTDVVEDELAYAMESLGVAPPVMRRRVEEVLDLLGLADVRDRPLATLSGGQQQRVAIGSVLTAHPRIVVLDEPTSALDPVAAEEVLALLQRLVHDLGITILMSEHRLERVVQYADRLVLVPGDGCALVVGDPAEILRTSPVAPPVVELGRLAGWVPLPLSIRDARRLAGGLRDRLSLVAVPPAIPGDPLGSDRQDTAAIAAVRTEKAVARYADLVALRGVDVTVRSGEVVALMGRNGAGKSTLLSLLAGQRRPVSGRVSVEGTDPTRIRPGHLFRHVGLVPQRAGDLLFGETVAAECRAADREAGVAPGASEALLARLAPGIPGDLSPRDLSEGQRLALALAVVLAAAPPLLLLDEPTRGLDYPGKRRLAALLRDLAAGGRAVVLATHDVELVAEVADRTLVLADGEVVSDGPTSEVVRSSPAFAPQVAKILAPLPWLTVPQVEAGLRNAS